jgi:formylglycine-generating enzyme required for sulfatase activity
LLVISDTAGPHWWDGLMFEALEAWSRRLPVAILHTLPHWMAQRTALRALAQAEIRNGDATASNSHYLVRDPDGWDDTPTRGGAVPVLSLDPGSLAPWSALVMGDGRLSIAGVRIPADRAVLEQRLEPLRPEALAPAVAQPSSAEELWQGFCRFASAEAQRLMMVLAAAPVLSLPVMRLIKEAMLPPASGPLPLQEVLLSGLLQPIAWSPEQEPDQQHTGRRDAVRLSPADADTLQYSFHAGVLELLRSDLSAADTVTVVRMVTGLLERRWNALGTGHSFRALLRDPGLEIDDEELKGVVNFATATAELIERLPGEEYQRFARQLRGRSPQPVRRVWPETMRFVSHDFTTALLVEVPELQPVRFETARLQNMPLERFPTSTCLLRQEGGRWRMERRPLQVEGYREDLGGGLALTMVKIPAGSFLMGSPEDEPKRFEREGPQHEVTLGSFFMAQTPITQAQWRAVAGWQKVERDLKPDPSQFNGANRPVEQVSWHEAMEFCRRLSQRTGQRYGLPSEAQWEYACRAGSTTPFHFGATLTPELANYDSNHVYGNGPKGTYREQTIDVASFPANGWGLHDMHGNVWEWCEDHWHDSYNFAPGDDQPWWIPAAVDNEPRLLRGGSWDCNPANCRSAFRNNFHPDFRFNDVGFRVCCLPQD